MLDLSTAVLCDFAQVRDRLLFVSSGAVSRLYRQELPSPLGLMVGLVIEVPLEDAGMDHRLRAEVINRHGTVLATLENLFRVSDAGLFPHEVQQVPLVLSITGVRARTWGTHQVRLYLDDELVRALTLYVVPAAGPQAVRPAPTQSRATADEGSLGGTGTQGVDTGDQPEEPAAERRDEAGEWGDQPSAGTAFELSDEGGAEPDVEASPAAQPAVEPDEGPAAEGGAEPEAVSWAAPDEEADAGADAEPGPGPSFPTATIDAEPAESPEPQVFDFDDGPDAGDAPADGDESESETEAQKEKSRFAFRYRYEEDES
jgi:hypothetical protein